MEILDSGNRREFESGAVRDVQDGKGRCDLLPLDVVSLYFNRRIDDSNPNKEKAVVVSIICHELDGIIRHAESDHIEPILRCIRAFVSREYVGNDGMAFMELAKHYEEGAKKYAERNWERGIPTHCYVDSCVRHLLKWYDGWTDEPHNRAVLWNLGGLLWTLNNKANMDDLPKNI